MRVKMFELRKAGFIDFGVVRYCAAQGAALRSSGRGGQKFRQPSARQAWNIQPSKRAFFDSGTTVLQRNALVAGKKKPRARNDSRYRQ
jgi:hypothetical protein